MRSVFVALCALGLMLGGCENKPGFNALDITGIQGYGNDFRLTDHTGKPRTMADFRGKVVVMFFGYTHCPDVCPTTLSEMRQVMQILGKDAARMQMLFVTVDPARDTPELLSKYVQITILTLQCAVLHLPIHLTMFYFTEARCIYKIISKVI